MKKTKAVRKIKKKTVRAERKAVKKKVKAVAKRNVKRAVPVAKKVEKPREADQITAQEAKYYPHSTPYLPPRQWTNEELPSRYGETRIVLMARDPRWLFAYWELTDEKRMQVEREANASWNELRKVLRVYDVTGKDFDGTNANRFFDIDITSEADDWYIHVGEPNKFWCVDLGVITRDGRFILIARSNIVGTPRDSASDVIDEEWMSIEEEFLKLYGLWGGFAGASPGKKQLKKIMREKLQQQLSSGAVSSFSRPAKYRGFWMIVNTELIVYGATEPDASVTVQGRPIKLNRDGTFSLRFALPDGEQVIPVKGVSADKAEERTITPIVKKHTK